MTRPRLLDLFCGAGGASMGYHRAGFDVVGVDRVKKRDYPFTLWSTNWDNVDPEPFDVIHASPPCQSSSITRNLAVAQGNKASDVDLIPDVRGWLVASGKPYVIENVPGAPLVNPVILCGSTFNLRVRRHRLFESNVMLMGHGPCRHAEQGRPVGVYGSPGDDIPRGGATARDLTDGQDAMGIDWMGWSSLKEAIPPAYTEYLGGQLLDALAVLPAL